MRLKTMLTTIGLGAGLMYFYDPNRGERRRALVRDQVMSLKNQTNDAIDISVRDLRNRTRGVLAEMTARLSETETPPDWIVEERVRAEIGRFIRHASAVEVSARQGAVTLQGPILAAEADRLVKAVSSVRGVRQVDNQLDVHENPDDIPALQGWRGTVQPDGQWSPAARLVGGAGGGLLALYGMTRKGLVGTTLSTIGLGLAARGVTNLDIRSLLGMSTNRHAIHVNKAINICAPIEELYRFWLNFENFPRFMAHLREVRDLGNGRSHWVATGPAGTQAEWDAIVTRNVPNQVIAWQSIAGSQVKTEGFVRFHRNPDGCTRVTVNMGYTPPAGAIGHAIAGLFGSDPKRAMDEDFARLKSLFETGETHVEGRRVTGLDLPGAAASY